MSEPLEIPHSRPTLERADHDALAECLAGHSIAQGKRVAAFESRVAARLGKRHALATSSGTSAIVLALHGLGLPSGAEVVLPSYVCHAVLDAVLTVGATPVLCDIGDDFVMTPSAVSRVVTRATGAIIVVHTFGIPVDSSAFRSFGAPIVDDVCQAFGAPIPEGADVICASFHATKVLTTGEGGMVLTNDAATSERMRLFRDGASDTPHARVPSPLTDLQAALGVAQLDRLDGFLARRRTIAETYFKELSGLALELPERVRDTSIFFRFPLRVDGAYPAGTLQVSYETIRARYFERRIHVRQGVDALLHRAMGLRGDAFPMTEKTFAETVCLPILPSMSDDDVALVVRATREIIRAR